MTSVQLEAKLVTPQPIISVVQGNSLDPNKGKAPLIGLTLKTQDASIFMSFPNYFLADFVERNMTISTYQNGTNDFFIIFNFPGKVFIALEPSPMNTHRTTPPYHHIQHHTTPHSTTSHHTTLISHHATNNNPTPFTQPTPFTHTYPLAHTHPQHTHTHTQHTPPHALTHITPHATTIKSLGPFYYWSYDPDFSVLVGGGDGSSTDYLLLEILLPLFFGLGVLAILAIILAVMGVTAFIAYKKRMRAPPTAVHY